MDQATEKVVLDIIDKSKDLTLATVRPDGYPQATTVSYAHDGLAIYVGIGKNSQKAENIRRNNKVSLTINNDYQDWAHIKGVSMGAHADLVDDPGEIRHAVDCMLQRFPEVNEWMQAETSVDMAFLKITPEVISILDYEKGFGHTDLVTV
ncbi:MAG TPA: pyridoxamine 5'-phosphate oxidase family protein [Burkholderiaceae bacterium]|nr:pyridoxamine 5'-phosphate oxidase family protein [Burkholderiaceae bacterium]